MEETILHGERVKHLRHLAKYVVEQEDDSLLNYTEVRMYQQDFFYVVKNNQAIPRQWYMQSKSNFHSHYDIYIIEYSNFMNITDDEDFKFYGFNINGEDEAVCADEPTNGEAPDGPTHVFPMPFLKHYAMIAKIGNKTFENAKRLSHTAQ